MGAHTPLIPQVFVICGVGALAGLTYSCFHSPLALRPADPVAPIPAPVAGTDATLPAAPLGLEISIAQAKALFDAGTPFVDARVREEYDQAHVAGAFHLTADMLTSGKTPDVLNFLDPSKPVVIYCGGGACDASHNVTALLQQLGFTQCHVMTDGYPGWSAAGHATSTDNPLGLAVPAASDGGANG